MIRILSAKLQIPAELKREPAQPGDVERTWANVSKAESALGYKPQVEFATGVGHFVNWFLRVGPPTNETSRRSEPSRETPALDLAALS